MSLPLGRIRTSSSCTTITKLAVPLVIFLTVFAVHRASPISTANDSLWSLYTARSILYEGNLDLAEYRETIREVKRYGLRKSRYTRRYYNFFPVGTSYMALPFVYLMESFPATTRALFPEVKLPDNNIIGSRRAAEKVIASAIVALATLFIYLIARESSLNVPQSALLSVTFAFGTSAWSTASRALWQHGPVMLLLAVGLYGLLLADRHRWLLGIVGVVLGFAYVTRPTAAIPLALLGLYVIYRHRWYSVYYFLGAGAVLLFFVLQNLEIYNNFLPPYYRAKRVRLEFFSFSNLAAQLISPGRGLFTFSPVLILIFPGLWMAFREKENRVLYGILGSVCLVHLVAVASTSAWWGGHSFGPRYMSDLLPFLIFFLVPLVRRSGKLLYLYGVLLLLSVVVHYTGACISMTETWNVYPASIDKDPSRVWDWSRPQFLSGF